MKIEKATKIAGSGVVVEFSKGSVFFPENFLSGIKMNPEKCLNWASIDQELFGQMSGEDIKNIARQINKQICRVGSLCHGVVYEYVNILPRKGNGEVEKEFVKISNAQLVKKGGGEYLQGVVDGKKYSVSAKTKFIAIGKPL